MIGALQHLAGGLALASAAFLSLAACVAFAPSIRGGGLALGLGFSLGAWAMASAGCALALS